MSLVSGKLFPYEFRKNSETTLFQETKIIQQINIENVHPVGILRSQKFTNNKRVKEPC